MNESLQSRILSQLEKNPQKQAFAFLDGSDSISWWSLEEYYERSAAVSWALSEAGLRPGEVCLVVLPSNEFCSHVLMGTFLAGGVPVLIAPPFLQEKGAFSSLHRILESVIRKSDPKLILCSDVLGAELKQSFPTVQICEKSLLKRDFETPDQFRPALPSDDDIAAMQLTSGTTGLPRICVWKQRNLLAALDGMWTAMDLNTSDVCFNWTPLYHDMGLVNNFLLCLSSGIPLAMLSPQKFVSRPSTWLRGLSNTGSTVTWSPNFGFALAVQRIRESELEDVNLDHVRAFWNAAERVHPETMHAFHERFAPYGVRKRALKTNFGCAENIGGATFSSPTNSFRFEQIDRDRFTREGVAQPVPAGEAKATVSVAGVGRAYPGLTIKILGPDESELEEGMIGQVALLSPSRMEGYLKDPEESARAVRGDLVLTGDLGYLRDGELFWVGRSQERINVRGRKLDPSDLEPILLQVPHLRKGCFAAFGVDDLQQGTQRLIIVSEVRRDTSASLAEVTSQIRSEALSRLGVNVSDVVLVSPDTLTKTSSGKRRHQFYRDLYLRGHFQGIEEPVPIE